MAKGQRSNREPTRGRGSSHCGDRLHIRRRRSFLSHACRRSSRPQANKNHERLPMTDHTSTGSCASRWDALLAENSILLKEHIDLLSSYTPPFSPQQSAQLEASAARRAELPKKIRKLVEEWTRSASL